MKTTSGKWLGFDVDMMQAYAQSMGVNLVMLDTKWDGIIPSLASGKCDAIASSMATTKERESGPRPRARPLRFQKAAATFPPKIFLGGLRGLAGILMESNTF